MRQKGINYKKLAATLIFIGAVFIFLVALISSIYKAPQLIFVISPIIYTVLLLDFLAYWLYMITVVGQRWIRIFVLGLSGILFIILSFSFGSASIVAYLSNTKAVAPITGTNIFISMIGLAVGGILYYMAFNGHFIYWIEEMKEKVEEREHRNKWFAKAMRKLKKV